MQGYVFKKAMSLGKTDWKLRYMTLAGHEVRYFESDREAASKGGAKKTLKLRPESVVKAIAHFHPHDIELRVKPGKILYFYCEALEEHGRWLAALSAAIAVLQPKTGAPAMTPHTCPYDSRMLPCFFHVYVYRQSFVV